MLSTFVSVLGSDADAVMLVRGRFDLAPIGLLEEAVCGIGLSTSWAWNEWLCRCSQSSPAIVLVGLPHVWPPEARIVDPALVIAVPVENAECDTQRRDEDQRLHGSVRRDAKRTKKKDVQSPSGIMA